MKIATKTKIIDGVQFDFDNGETVKVLLEDMSDSMLAKLAIHGLTQKLGDSYASSVTVSEAVEKFYDTLTNLKAGVWNGGRSASAGGIWIEAIAKATGRTMEEAKVMFDGKGEKEQKAIKKHPQVVAAKAEIDLERAQAKVKANPIKEGATVDALFA